MAHWVTFKDGTTGCIELLGYEQPKYPSYPTDTPLDEVKAGYAAYNGAIEAAVIKKALDEAGKEVAQVQRLPYPAEPRIGKRTDCPSFCWKPQSCAGFGSCPRSISCTE